MADARFDVFLCHHSADKPSVRRLAAELARRGLKPWLDEEQLRPGLPWMPALEEQLESIGSAAVFVGRAGFGPWQEQEVGALLRLFVRREAPVIPVLLAECVGEPKLPLFLDGMTWVDFRVADPDPMERLVWGITGQHPAPHERSVAAPPPAVAPPASTPTSGASSDSSAPAAAKRRWRIDFDRVGRGTPPSSRTPSATPGHDPAPAAASRPSYPPAVLAPPPPTLAEVLPGTWDLQVAHPLGLQARFELAPGGLFRGMLVVGGGLERTTVEGTWAVTGPALFVLSGRQSNGFQVVPYAVTVAVEHLARDVIAGSSIIGERFEMRRVAPAP